MEGWRIASIVAHVVQCAIILTLLKEFHFVDPALYDEVMAAKSNDVIHVASELGRFDMASLLLGIVSILIALAAIFGFAEVRWRSEKKAEETARLVVEQKVPALFNEALKARGSLREFSIDIGGIDEKKLMAKASEIKRDG